MFTADFFTGNRRVFYRQLPSDSLLILTANGLLQRDVDQPYAFEQESNFWYLTGLNEADWYLLVDIDSSKEWLIAPSLTAVQKTFNGELDPGQASRTSGIESVIDEKSGLDLLKKLAAKKKHAFTIKPLPKKHNGFYTNPAQRDLQVKLKGCNIQDARLTLAKIRAVKQPVEIKALQAAAKITKHAIDVVQAALPALKYEHEVEALLDYEFKRHGYSHAFDPITAFGANATTLHYQSNNQRLGANGLILLDVGAKVNGYCADISRTLPIRDPSPRQLQILEAVKKIQKQTIELCKSGVSIKKYHQRFCKIAYQEMRRLGLIKSDDPIEKIFDVMPHAIGHGLGLDVHESLGQPEKFVPGMVMTVEPGIYLKNEGIGVRFEDDILITKDGPRILGDD